MAARAGAVDAKGAQGNRFEAARKYPGTVIEPVTPHDAIASTLLPGEFHRDPADRLIVALARRYAAPIVTCDRRIIEYPHVETIW